jgi:Fur family transcriptional regulator, ferric uptake regulator
MPGDVGETAPRRADIFLLSFVQGVECLRLSNESAAVETLMTEEQEVFLKHIQKQGLKRTAQRDLILDVFLRTEGHVSGEDLYRLVREQDPTVGQTTVYRTLRLLTEAGLAREVRFGDGRAHYEHNYKHEHHDHMICSECGKIIEFYSPELEAIQDAMAAKYKFELTEHLLRMIGVCADCRRAGREKKPDGAHRPRVRAAARHSHS